MSKGPRIDDDVKRLVARVNLQHPYWQGKDVQAEVDRLCRGRGPGLSAIQKLLKGMRQQDVEGKVDELTRPWHLGTLSKYPLPAESIPRLLEIQRERRQRGEPLLNMREARWAARLHKLLPEPAHLSLAAGYYALYEGASELAGVACDTRSFDEGLLDGTWMVSTTAWAVETLRTAGWELVDLLQPADEIRTEDGEQ